MTKQTEISSRSAAYLFRPEAAWMIEPRIEALRAHLEHMARSYYQGENFVFYNDPLRSAKTAACFVNDLAALWDIAAGCDPNADSLSNEALEFYLWREALKDQDVNLDIHPSERDRDWLNNLMLKNRSALFGPLIFAAGERLEGDALEIFFNEEFWRLVPTVEPLPSGTKLLHRIKPDWLWEKMTKPAPKYEINATKANATLKAWRLGEIKPKSHKERQHLAADLLKAAVWFWNKNQNANARQVFAALQNKAQAPNETARELIQAARDTFAKIPTTARTIRNILTTG